jgi:DNA processing protein
VTVDGSVGCCPVGSTLRSLRTDGREIHHPAELALNDLERAVLAAVPQQASTVDAVIATSGLPAPQVLATLSVLEMRRLIQRLSGNSVLRL